MIQSLRNSAAGINAQLNRMDISSNNIANISTNSFKRGRAEFADLLYGKMADCGRPVNLTGNAGEPLMGSGSRVVAVNTVFEQGVVKETGRPLDIAISGNGFFRVELPDGSYAYTRDGNFQLTSERTLVTAGGYKLQPEITLPENYKSFDITPGGTVIVTDDGGEATELGNILLYKFPDGDGLKHTGGNLYAQTDQSGDAEEGVPGENGLGQLLQQNLEMSNVDLAEEMAVVIESQRALQAGAQSLKTADQLWNIANNLRK
ncbi:flagellar basal-body rod protein FlgG [Desulfocucumis palustris]|uniref:Flagellar basal-body rod protein FlgG n=1 Tax=Desulfocucumis palustris TaxID=1898651 RepID=A0A2L2XAA8_9FIRM|nr:flagellar basal-body rod protein FlgG [Desulfocucumis palustris]GBF33209.1 flagellar basal-body rod protein FlgG [Desulfocucumis palustris]